MVFIGLLLSFVYLDRTRLGLSDMLKQTKSDVTVFPPEKSGFPAAFRYTSTMMAAYCRCLFRKNQMHQLAPAETAGETHNLTFCRRGLL